MHLHAVAPAGYALTSPTVAAPCNRSEYAPALNRLSRCLRCQSGLEEPPTSTLAAGDRSSRQAVCSECLSGGCQQPACWAGLLLSVVGPVWFAGPATAHTQRAAAVHARAVMTPRALSRPAHDTRHETHRARQQGCRPGAT
jgi:hypothetical protein